MNTTRARMPLGKNLGRPYIVQRRRWRVWATVAECQTYDEAYLLAVRVANTARPEWQYRIVKVEWET